MKRVAILGCGPAGLLAAHAAQELGHLPTIFSRKIKSKIFGAMYVHRAIPGATPIEPQLTITVMKSGCREGYAENVYGDPQHPVSWDKFEEGEVHGWDMKKMYDLLWIKFQSRTHHVDDVDPAMIERICGLYDLTISTLPLNLVCVESHDFVSQKMWVVHGPGTSLVPNVNDNDMMYYNGYTPNGRYGAEGPDWYRFSQINRYQSWEYSREPTDWHVGNDRILSTGYKPTKTDCDCFPEVMRVGRFGKWDKSALTHHAYEEVLLALQ